MSGSSSRIIRNHILRSVSRICLSSSPRPPRVQSALFATAQHTTSVTATNTRRTGIICANSFSTSHTAAAMSAAETDAQAAQNANVMDITPDSLSSTLKEKIGAIYCTIEDMSGGCGQAFEAVIVSPQFEKKNSLARHRLVNGALKKEIAAIHAWTPKCYTPEEWEKKQST